MHKTLFSVYVKGKFVFLVMVSLAFVYLCATPRMHFSCK